jgi:hypothetical protein
MLIDAADHLPKWISPEIETNRVFIRCGKVYLIPIDVSKYPNLPDGPLTLEQALKIMNDSSIETLASPEIQKAILYKINGYPQKINENIHHARCIIPQNLAYLLHEAPELLTHAVEAFVTREPSSAKVCMEMATFSPKQPMLETTIAFTRLSFAQLVCQPFFPPKPFNLPVDTDPSYKKYNTGMRVACAFEILHADAHLRNMDSSSPSFSETDPTWKTYVSNLNKYQYFEDEKEGSRRYQELLAIAKNHFVSTETPQKMKVNPYSYMKSILGQPLPSDSISYVSNLPEDSEDWMLINPEELNTQLENEEQLTAEELGLDQEPLDKSEMREFRNLEKLIEKFESFVEKESGLEGVTISEDEEDEEEEGLDIDPELFKKVLFQQLGIPIAEEEEDVAELMEQMDLELSETKVGRVEEGEVCYNLAENILESFSSQQGMSGPAETIIRSLGLKLPK